MTEWNIENWLDNYEITNIEYSEYWNDEEKEKNKEWYILDDNFSKMEDHLQEIGLLRDLKLCIETLNSEFKLELKGVGIDLAAGNLWAAPYLLNFGKIEKLYCLEYSKHRLIKIGKKVLEHYGVPKDKIVLIYGSFYDLHLLDNSLDFVFLSQAFHHADKPAELLSEIHRVLKPGGIVIIIGEHIVNYKSYLVKHGIMFLISKFIPEIVQQKIFRKTFHTKTLLPQSTDGIPRDPILGDHYYTDNMYRSMFSKYGFRIKNIKNHKTHFQAFVLVNSTE